MENEFQKKYFKTNVLIKNIIGKELINDDNVAVMELVKNSYDAGATKVNIEFKNIFSDKKKSELVIQDNGVGMDEDDILNKWLNIAYSSKKIEHTQNKRFQAGNKGVGRFSCDRLGESLNIYTRKANQTIIHLKINWKDFELIDEIDTQIQDIPVFIREIDDNKFEEESGFKLFEKGTILQILDLNSYWLGIDAKNTLFKEFNFDTKKLLALKNSLERLINPNQQYDNESFKIYIKIPELQEDKKLEYHKRITGEVKNQIFDKLNFKTTFIESYISEDGLEIVTELKDKNKTIFRLIEKNKNFNLLKDIKIVIYYLNPYAKGFFTKQTGIQPVEFGSVFLFINGFRIPPYGDRENDALGLEVRKNQGRARYFGNREILGRIEIKDFENNFRVISSREGIVQNEFYKQLIRDSDKNVGKYGGFFYSTLKRLEKYVVDGLKWDSLPEDVNESTVQKEIVEGKWNGVEKYKINDNEKIVNASALIKQILSINPQNVLDLYINDELVENLIEEDKEKTKKKLEDFIKNFGSIPIDRFDEKTQKSLKKLTSNIEDEELVRLYKDTLSKKEKIEKELQEEQKSKEELYKLYKKRVKEERKKRKKEIEEKKKLELELENTKKEKTKKEEQVLFLKSIQSIEKTELIKLQHHIGLYAEIIEDTVLDFKLSLEDGEVTKEDIINYLKDISLEAQKILAINKYATKAKFLSRSQSVKVNIVKFIEEYIQNIYRVNANKDLNIEVNTSNIVHICKFEPIIITIIVDNLLNNSKKANAKNIRINFIKEDNLILEYIDDGDGLDSSIVNPNDIFEIGITTTDGSGLGLNHIKESLFKMKKSTIKVEKLDNGIKFIIRFNI